MDYYAPDQLIVCNDNFINIKIELFSRNINSYPLFYKYPSLFPILKSIENGFVLSEYIEKGQKIGHLCKDDDILKSKLGFVDFTPENILLKDNKKYIVDCEIFSFIYSRPELNYNNMLKLEANFDFSVYNYNIYNKEEILYAGMKFLNDNSDKIKNEKKTIVNDEDNWFVTFDILLRKYILLHYNNIFY
jgi:hypothetical protein